MKHAFTGIIVLTLLAMLFASPPASLTYPSNPAHGGRLCLDCHKAEGQWQSKGLLVADILDARSGRSYKSGNNEFSIPFSPGEEKALIAIFGVRQIGDNLPDRVGWALLDDDMVKNGTLASPKFPSGWLLNKPYGFSYIDEKDAIFADAKIARVPFAMQPGPDAKDAEVTLHLLVQGGRDISGKQTVYEKALVRLKLGAAKNEGIVSSQPKPLSAETPPIELSKRGMEIFREKKCGACHKLDGVGGTTGPELTRIGGERSRDQLEKYLRNPSSVYPGSFVKPIELSEEKLATLLDFLESLK
jgi:cytochrome c2